MRTFVKLTKLNLEDQGIIETPVWVDPLRVIAVSGDDKEYATGVLFTNGIFMSIKGKLVEVAHKLDIKLGGLRVVPKLPPDPLNRTV